LTFSTREEVLDSVGEANVWPVTEVVWLFSTDGGTLTPAEVAVRSSRPAYRSRSDCGDEQDLPSMARE